MHVPRISDFLLKLYYGSIKACFWFIFLQGVKEAAHRDYKAILSTSDKSDPKEDRDMAKAARRYRLSYLTSPYASTPYMSI